MSTSGTSPKTIYQCTDEQMKELRKYLDIQSSTPSQVSWRHWTAHASEVLQKLVYLAAEPSLPKWHSLVLVCSAHSVKDAARYTGRDLSWKAVVWITLRQSRTVPNKAVPEILYNHVGYRTKASCNIHHNVDQCEDKRTELYPQIRDIHCCHLPVWLTVFVSEWQTVPTDQFTFENSI